MEDHPGDPAGAKRMGKQIRPPPAKASQPLRHCRGVGHDEDVSRLRLLRLTQHEIEDVRPEVRSRIATGGYRDLARAPGEEMEPESERAGSRVAPAGRAAVIG